MIIGDLLNTAKNFIVGDTSQQRDKLNSSNWEQVNQARNNYSKALAYQSAMKNYFDEHPEEDSSVYSDVLSDDFLKSYSSDVKNANDYYKNQYTKNRWNEFGSGGIINETLNPIMQTVSAGTNTLSTLNGGEGDNWSLYGNQLNNGSYRNRRDLASDIGALGETALAIGTLGTAVSKTLGKSIAKGALTGAGSKTLGKSIAKGALGETALTIGTLGTGAGSKTLGKSIAKGALTGAGFSAANTLREKGSEASIGDLALGAGIGGILGGAASGIGYGVDKLATGAQNARNAANQYNYQEAMQRANAQTTNLLGDGVGGASVVSNPKIDWLKSRGNLAKTKLGQAAQVIGDIASLAKATGYNPLEKIANSKVGQTTSKILSTKTGKVGAGVAGGLLLSKILNGNNSNDTDLSNLSDEELEQLYNYYYGGQ